MTMADLVVETLEHYAEHCGDITPAAFERWHDLDPTAATLMSHTDDNMRGRMMTEVLNLLMVEDLATLESYLDYEATTHVGYGAPFSSFRGFLDAVKVLVREACAQSDAYKSEGSPEGWTDLLEQAWNDRIDAVLEAFARTGAFASQSENAG